MVFPHWSPIEHRIERSDLVYVYFTHIQYLRYLVHSTQRHPVPALLLRYVEQRNYCGALVVAWVFGHYPLDLTVVVVGEVEGRVWVVVGSVLVSGEGV